MVRFLKLCRLFPVVVPALCCFVPPASADPRGGGQDRPITLAEARVLALDVVPGQIVDGRLENAIGGTGQRYEFKIRFDDKDRLVGIDAITGFVLENSIAGP